MRVERVPGLETKIQALCEGTREFWRLKQDLAKVLWTDVEKVISALQDRPRADLVKAEFFQVFGDASAGDLQGIFWGWWQGGGRQNF